MSCDKKCELWLANSANEEHKERILKEDHVTARHQFEKYHHFLRLIWFGVWSFGVELRICYSNFFKFLVSPIKSYRVSSSSLQLKTCMSQQTAFELSNCA